MLQAFVLGAVAQVSLVLSGLVVYWVKVPRAVIGALAGLGAGALLAAIGADLLPEAKTLANWQIAAWMLFGAAVFFLADKAVERRFGEDGSAGPLGIVVGAVVDGVPESIIFGVQLAAGLSVSVAFLAAVFVSNIPQALAPSAGLAESGWSKTKVAGMWTAVLLACGISSALGFALASSFSDVTGDRIAALAAGGILAMLSDSLLPFAHERSVYAGIFTVVGFCGALALA